MAHPHHAPQHYAHQATSWGWSHGGAAPPQTDRSGPSFEHYRDGGVLPWWAWAGIGTVVIACGALVVTAVSPAALDPTRSGFDPKLNSDYADMTVLPAGAAFEGSVDDVPWQLEIVEVNWYADDQAGLQTSLPDPASGMRYVGIDVLVSAEQPNTTPVDEAFLFYYLAPSGQEYSEHYCGSGCLSDSGGALDEYEGWIYFEVPQSVPDGGHLRVNLLYSGQPDTLMELL